MTNLATTEVPKYEGRRNQSKFPFFINICKLDQPRLKKFVAKQLKRYYPKVVKEDGFVYAKGTDPVLLTAHMDTVHDKTVTEYYEKEYYSFGRRRMEHLISSPQGIGGDDRCGIFMILTILKETKLRPSILFCEDEEIGGVGSKKFCKTQYVEDLKELKFFIELDRANANDAVYYDCGNKEFAEFVQKITEYKEAYGSFSDISHLSPATDIASVNLSCGYYNAHTVSEYVIAEEMFDTIEATINLVTKAQSEDVKAFDYEEEVFWNYYSRKTWSNEDYFGYTFSGLNIDYFDLESGDNVKQAFEYVDGESYYECLGHFFAEHPYLCMDDLIEVEEVYY